MDTSVRTFVETPNSLASVIFDTLEILIQASELISREIKCNLLDTNVLEHLCWLTKR